MYGRTIVEERPENIAVMDVFSKLIQERIIFIDNPITAELANGVVAQMLYLDSVSNEKINIYINSPGGIITQGLAIYDVSKLLKSPIRTVGIGEVASMGAVLMLMGEERCGLENTRFMLHQPSGGYFGTLEENRRLLEEMEHLEEILYGIILEKTTIPNIKDTLLFDTWMDSEKALSYDLINKIL
jgi:ATP-dependent Clp protease protease subunit